MALSRFAEEWMDASSNIDDIFGEAFFYTPMMYAGGRHSPDPTRPEVLIVAALDEKAGMSEPIGQRNASGMSKGIVNQHATTELSINIASDAIPYEPRSKDRLVRERDGAIFEISGVLQDNFARIDLRVFMLGEPL